MWNDELTLMPYKVVPDEIGNQKKVYSPRVILCSIQSTTRNEFYNYGSADLRPEYVATVNTFEYEGEKEAIFRGEQYFITRVYEVDRDLTELTLSRRIQR